MIFGCVFHFSCPSWLDCWVSAQKTNVLCFAFKDYGLLSDRVIKTIPKEKETTIDTNISLEKISIKLLARGTDYMYF